MFNVCVVIYAFNLHETGKFELSKHQSKYVNIYANNSSPTSLRELRIKILVLCSDVGETTENVALAACGLSGYVQT